MKKIFYLTILSLVLVWCSSTKQDTKSISSSNNNIFQQDNIETCNKYFSIWSWINQSLSLKAKVVSSNIKNIISNNAWIVSKLNCENWKTVNSKTLLATIKPDWTDPNIKNLLNQKSSLNNQILNIKNIISSTQSDFSLQNQSLENQKKSLENQIQILESSLNKIINQKKYWVNDLKSQLSSLQTQLKDLKTSEATLEKSKITDLNKLNQSIKNSISQSKSLSKNVLLQIDEMYGITDTNKHKNDSFENYLWVKNTSIKEEIKNVFLKLNNNLPTNDTWWSDYLRKIDDLANLVKENIKDSVVSRNFSQKSIDSYYGIFVTYDNNLISLKNTLDTLINSLETVKNNYDNQIINLKTQINTISNQITNINQNKLNSYTSNLDIQTNQTKSQLDNLKTNLTNIISQIDSLYNKEKIQIKQLENQLTQLKTSLNKININLQEQNIYAGITWKIKSKNVSVWNKIWPNSLLCQIVPNKAWLKLQIYTNINLQIGTYISFENNNKLCKTNIVSLLPYKESVSQNNIYETDNSAVCSWQKIDLSNILTEWKIINVNYNNKDIRNLTKSIKIPLDFIINKLTGKYVKKVFSWWKIKSVKIELNNIDWLYSEIWSWLSIGDKICK